MQLAQWFRDDLSLKMTLDYRCGAAHVDRRLLPARVSRLTAAKDMAASTKT